MRRTQKVEYIAKQLGIAPRTVWAKLKKGEISMDQFEFSPDPEFALIDAAKSGNDAELAVIPTEQIMEDYRKTLIDLGKLQERLEWITADRNLLQQKIRLLEAPKAESASDQGSTGTVQDQKKKSTTSLLDRLRVAWYGFVQGGLPQTAET